MLGTGANGKSTIIEVIQSLIGEANFTSLKLDELSEKFAVCELDGKLANFSPEHRTSHIKNEATFKGLVDGSHTSVDVKFKGRLNFKPYAKLWIASNPLPASRDTTKGFIRRFLFLKFPVEFEYSSSKTDLNRAAKIIKSEMSGVLNWAVEGLRMLNQQGFEPFPKCHHEIFEETCSVINPRIDFIKSFLSRE